MLFKNPSVPQRCSNCLEARSPRTVWRWLASSLRLSPHLAHERAAPRGTAGLSALPARVFPALLSFSTDCRLQASDFHAAPRPLQTDRAWRSVRRYMGSVRRSLTSALRSLTPRWLRPLGCFDPNFGRSLHRADVDEITDPARRGNLCICWAAPLLVGNPPWPAQRWRRFGDEGEAMLFVSIYWGGCGLGDGEEMSLL